MTKHLYAIIITYNTWHIIVKKITFQLADKEFDLLESYCEQVERGKTEVLRELVRSLEAATKGVTR